MTGSQCKECDARVSGRLWMCTVFSIPPTPHLEERAVVEVDARVHRGDAAGDGDVLRPATQMQKLNAHGQHADAILRHDFLSSLFFFAIRFGDCRTRRCVRRDEVRRRRRSQGSSRALLRVNKRSNVFFSLVV